MKKLLVALLSVCVLCFGFAGCGTNQHACPSPSDHENVCVNKEAHTAPISLGLKCFDL